MTILKSRLRQSAESCWPLKNANGKTFAEQKLADNLKQKFRERTKNVR